MSLLNNARWVAFSQATKIGAQVIGMMILARLVSPGEYGVMAMASVVTNFAMIFRDMGSSAALIQRPILDETIKTTVFWFNVAVGTIIAIIVVIISPWVVEMFHTPKLSSVLLLLALVFPVSSCGAAHQALLERESRFKTVARVEITATLIGLAVAITMGWLGMGVYSLVAQTLVMMGLSSLQLWIVSEWRPQGLRKASWSHLKSIFGFSANLVGFNIVNYFSRNADNIIIGHYFSAKVLGYYSLAYRVMLFPLQSLTFVVSRSMYPLLAKQQSDAESMKKIYLQVVAIIATIVAPVMAGMVMLRNEFITLFLGKGWELSSVLLLWLAPTGFIQSILSTTGVVFMAKSATRTLMWLGIVGAILQVGAFMLGVWGGVEMMVKLYLIANIINAIPVLVLCMRQMEGSILEVFRAIYAPVLCSFIMIVFLNFLLKFIGSLNLNFILLIGVGSGALVYIIIFSILDRKRVFEIIQILRRKNVKP